MVLKVYLDPATVNSRKVLAGLDMLGTPFELHPISFSDNEHKSEDFLKINPNGTVPAATDGDLTIFESNAILMYAADLNSNQNVYPREPRARADANCWLFWEQTSWFPPSYIYMTEYVFKPLGGQAADPEVIKEAEPRFHAKAAILEARLAKTGGWILGGSEPTLVDVAMGSSMHFGAAQKLPLEGYPSIRRWFAELVKLPCWVKTQVAVDNVLLEP